MKKRSLGKIRKSIISIALCILLGSLLVGCGGDDNSSDADNMDNSSEPYVVKLDGVEVKPGQTMVQALADLGFEFSDASGRELVIDENGGSTMVYANVYDLTYEAEAMTLYSSVDLLKDGERVASLSIVNDTESEIPLSDCKIVTVNVYTNDTDYEKVSIEGVAFSNLSADSLKDALGEPQTNTESKTEWKRGDYGLQVEYENGKVSSIRTNYTGMY